MKKTRLNLLSLVAAAIVVTAFAVSASAQAKPFVADKKYVNNPCSNPQISWALWNESAGFNAPTGGFGTVGDCDPRNYGTWVTAPQLEANLASYRQMLRVQGFAMSVLVASAQKFAAIISSKGIVMAFNAANQAVSAYYVVSIGNGHLVELKAKGGTGPLKDAKAGNVVSTGTGAHRGIKAVGDTVVQLPGYWVKLH